MIAIQPQSRQLLGVNQQAYQSLKAAMGLDLRRQLLIAVCDDVALQNQLATQLQNDLEEMAAIAQLAANTEGDQRPSQAISPSSLGEWACPGSPEAAGQRRSLERLWFDPEDANLTRQIARWMQQTMLIEGALPQVQMLGLEQMTRQPAITQNHFLRSLEKIEALLPRLNTSLLVWVTWPWLRTIQQSAPTFWHWRNGVFEFVSDPTPTAAWQKPLPLDDTSETSASKGALKIDISQADIPQDHQPAVSEADLETGLKTDLNADLKADLKPDLKAECGTRLLAGLYGEAGEGEVTAAAIHRAVCSPPCPECEASNPDISDMGNLGLASRPDAPNTSDDFESAVLPQKPLKKQIVETAGGLHSIVSQGSSAAGSATVTGSLGDMDGLDDIALIFAEPNVGERQQGIGDRRQETGGGHGTGDRTGAQEKERQEKERQEKERQEETGKQAEQTAEEQKTDDKQKAADDYFAVGYVYRSRIEAGERGLALIEPAIAAYEGGLRCLVGSHPDWGSNLNDLGTLYWLKAQQLSDPQQSVDCMTHSITLYQEALTKIDPQQPVSIAGQLYSNIGAVYSLLATYEEPVAYLQAAATAYGQALQLGPVALSAEEFAVLQNSLGSVYWKLSHYDAAQPNLYRAIAAYKAACSSYRPDQQPLDYAAVQNNLGITYWSLAKYEQTQDLLKQAIAAYSNALKYRTPEVDPATCAITYNNLALAYWDLSKAHDLYLDQKLRYQRNAIIAFEAALNISQAASTLSKMDSAAIYHCLGDVHAQMAETASSVPDIAESLQKSLYSYLQAIDALPANSPAYQSRVNASVAKLRAHYSQLGLAGQQAALNTVPPALLSQIMMAL